MTTVEKIGLAKSNKYINLFMEGLFYKCYNQDVMVFVKNVKQYKVSEKFIKSVGAVVYSIGFPLSEVEKGKLTLEFISERMGDSGFVYTSNPYTHPYRHLPISREIASQPII